MRSVKEFSSVIARSIFLGYSTGGTQFRPGAIVAKCSGVSMKDATESSNGSLYIPMHSSDVSPLRHAALTMEVVGTVVIAITVILPTTTSERKRASLRVVMTPFFHKIFSHQRT
mmetsp:Transcript_23582/g.22611  ORF Transcript_23582/g.22611 Transcript_23582/m.22611 type:complete len:114 (-) Transcript_23582:230-571(-)